MRTEDTDRRGPEPGRRGQRARPVPAHRLSSGPAGWCTSPADCTGERPPTSATSSGPAVGGTAPRRTPRASCGVHRARGRRRPALARRALQRGRARLGADQDRGRTPGRPRPRRQTQAWLAAGDDPVADVTGGYWYHRKRQTPDPLAMDTDFQDRVLDRLAGFHRHYARLSREARHGTTAHYHLVLHAGSDPEAFETLFADDGMRDVLQTTRITPGSTQAAPGNARDTWRRHRFGVVRTLCLAGRRHADDRRRIPIRRERRTAPGESRRRRHGVRGGRLH